MKHQISWTTEQTRLLREGTSIAYSGDHHLINLGCISEEQQFVHEILLQCWRTCVLTFLGPLHVCARATSTTLGKCAPTTCASQQGLSVPISVEH